MCTRRLSVVTIACSLAFATPSFGAVSNIPGWLKGTAIGEQSEVYPWLRLTINIPARELRVIERNQIIATYKVAIGQPRYPSPVMSDDINRIVWNPSWIPPNSPWAKGAKVAPPGPRNPLGPVKMPIAQGILVHGTNKPWSVGRAASHGCFRMKSEEAMHLAWYLQERASTKTDPSLWERYRKHRYRTQWVTLEQAIPVDVVYEPAEYHSDTLFLYPDVYRRVRDWKSTIANTLEAHGVSSHHVTNEMVAQFTKQLAKGPTSISLHDLKNSQVAAHIPPAK